MKSNLHRKRVFSSKPTKATDDKLSEKSRKSSKSRGRTSAPKNSPTRVKSQPKQVKQVKKETKRSESYESDKENMIKQTQEQINKRRILTHNKTTAKAAKKQDQQAIQEQVKLTVKDVVEFYQKALSVFQCKENEIVGRHQEEKEIKDFLTQNSQKDLSGLLYICGHPGTGKTSLVTQILNQEFEDSSKYCLIMVNGNSYPKIENLFSDLRSKMSTCLQQSKYYNKKSMSYINLKTPKNLDTEDQYKELVDFINVCYKLCRLKHIILMIDEIDAFSFHSQASSYFNIFLKILLKFNTLSVSVIGIANSVELFKGELTSSNNKLNSAFLCQNEMKIIFTPYDKSKVTLILKTLVDRFIHKNYSTVKSQNSMRNLIDQRSYDMVALKVEKVSGDLRTSFNIMQCAITEKVKFIKSLSDKEAISNPKTLLLTYEDVNKAIIEIYQSKTANIIKQVPRSHLIFLQVLYETFENENVCVIGEDRLLDLFNRRYSGHSGQLQHSEYQGYQIQPW
eukprot:403332685